MIKCIKPILSTMPASRITVEPKQADAHYLSAEHKAWRRSVMERAGWRCQHPGCDKRSPKDRLFADHIIEISDGGDPLDVHNGQALCGAHHSAKTMKARAARR